MAKPTITGLFGVELPVIQAPMAGSQGSALAIAVSNAGGLGSLPCAMLSPDQMRSELQAITWSTSHPYNVNFFVHSEPVPNDAREAEWLQLLAPYFAELGLDSGSVTPGPKRLPFNDAAADVLEAFKPPVVSFHFGLPSAALMRRVKSWGSKIISSATTVEEAKYLDERGVDAIIAQGSDAGGHRAMFLTTDLHTQLPARLLVPQIVAAVSVPVIAAGGIAESRDVTAAVALGASGVQAGTAYLFCPEANTNPLHRAALKSDRAEQTAITNLLTGRPARGIVNRLMREIGPINPSAPQFPLAASAIATLRAKAEPTGSDDFTSLWAGQNARNCREIAAADLTRQLGSGIVAAMKWRPAPL